MAAVSLAHRATLLQLLQGPTRGLVQLPGRPRAVGRRGWRAGVAVSAVRRRPRDPPGSRAQEEEPFDAELAVLFGLPTFIVLLPAAVNEPRTLAVVIPVLLLIPGTRDVILHVAGDLVTGLFRARRFMAEPRPWQPPPPPEAAYGKDFKDAPAPFYSEAAAPYLDAEYLDAEEEAPPAGRQAAAPRAARPRAATSRADYEPREVEPTGAGREGAGPAPRRPSVYYNSASRGPRPLSPPDPRDRIVRPSAQGRVGVDVQRQKPSLFWQPLLAVFPFLRYWGGFF